MSEICTLENEVLTVQISTRGAELVSVRAKDGEELLWYGDPAWWEGHSPLLFPICSSLKGGEYRHGGKTYSLPQHGFAKSAEFTLLDAGADHAAFLLTDTKETRAVYPFSFRLTVSYTLCGGAIEVRYSTENTGEETMYYSIGSHEGFSLPEGVEAYEVVFAEEETLATCVLDGPILSHEATPVLEKSRHLPLKTEYFAIDALIFERLASRSLSLRRKDGGRSFSVEFPDFDHLLIWQPQGAPFVCIEPWTGMPDYVDVSGKLAEKPFITPLDPKTSRTHFHRVTFKND